MNTTKSYLLIALMAVLSTSLAYAQPQEPEDPLKEFKQPPLPAEKFIGEVTDEIYLGNVYIVFSKNRRGIYTEEEKQVNNVRDRSDSELIESLLEKAKKLYGGKYPNFSLRNYKSSLRYDYVGGDGPIKGECKWYCNYSANVVVFDPTDKEYLSKLIEKAMKNVPQDSRVSIDQIEVISGINENNYKDYLIELLLDKGYKVVAKEFMQRLYEEQKQQQTGVYNEETTVQENNFSAVGYYVNIRMTEKGLRMQIVNVSTGEYEGNASINY